jgi:hypothetical protein
VSNALRLFVAVFLCVRCIPGQSPVPESGAKPIVLKKNDGDLRTRRPREGVASPSSDFLLMVGPKTSGSKHLLLVTEKIRPGAVVPRHKHHIPAETWISLKSTGKESISLVAIWNEPGFEEMLLCGSVPKGRVGELLSRDGVKNCYHHGDAELETVQPPADKKM